MGFPLEAIAEPNEAERRGEEQENQPDAGKFHPDHSRAGIARRDALRIGSRLGTSVGEL